MNIYKSKYKKFDIKLIHFLPTFSAAFLAAYLASYSCCLSKARCAF